MQSAAARACPAVLQFSTQQWAWPFTAGVISGPISGTTIGNPIYTSKPISTTVLITEKSSTCLLTRPVRKPQNPQGSVSGSDQVIPIPFCSAPLDRSEASLLSPPLLTSLSSAITFALTALSH